MSLEVYNGARANYVFEFEAAWNGAASSLPPLITDFKLAEADSDSGYAEFQLLIYDTNGVQVTA